MPARPVALAGHLRRGFARITNTSIYFAPKRDSGSAGAILFALTTFT
jgi:hypothetical protein